MAFGRYLKFKKTQLVLLKTRTLCQKLIVVVVVATSLVLVVLTTS
jgi:hypothetical protein